MLSAVDIERTIQFILESQAKAEVRMTGISKLLQQGMLMLVKTDSKLAQLAASHKDLVQAQKELTKSQKELTQAQRATERSLKAFMDSLRNGQNGH